MSEFCPECSFPLTIIDGLWYCPVCDAYHGEAELDDDKGDE